MSAEPHPLPRAWKWVHLGEVSRLVTGGTPPGKEQGCYGGSIPFFKPTDLNAGRFVYEARQSLSPFGAGFLDVVPAGSVLITCIGATIGKVGLSAVAGATNQQINAVVPVELDPAFLYWFVVSPSAQEWIAENASATTLPILNKSRLATMPIPLAPRAEQHRVAAKLDALHVRSRRAREALAAVPPLLEKLRQSILAAAFRGDLTKDWRAKNKNIEPATELLKRIRIERRQKWEQAELAKLKAKGKTPTDDRWKAKYKEPEPVDTKGLPELPEGWCWATLGELAWDAGYGTSAKCDYEGKGVAVLRIPNIARGLVDLSDVKRAAVVRDEGAMLVVPGDLLIVRTNGSRDLIGRAAVIVDEPNEPTSFASYLIRFRLIMERQLPAWVARYWQSPFVRGQIEAQAASSAGQYNVSLGELSQCPVPVAPSEEQSLVLGLVEALLAPRMNAERALRELLQKFGSLEQSVLAKAFRGQLLPQDPNDAPVSPQTQPAPTPSAQLRSKAPIKKNAKNRS